MICTVGMQRPDGTRIKTTGYYDNPGAAMDWQQAAHPDWVVNSAVAHKPVVIASGRSCDELGVCQSVTKPCPTNTMCARKNSPFYFESSAADDSGYLLDTTWQDWLGGMLIVVVLSAIYGWLA
jgi:hypothetical protein